MAYGVDHVTPVGDTGTAGHLAAGNATGDEVCGPGAWGRVLKNFVRHLLNTEKIK